MNDTADEYADGVAWNGEPCPAAIVQQSQSSHNESSHNLVSGNIYPTCHHYGYGCLYADQAEATQMYANGNNAWTGHPPFGDYNYNYYSHHHNFGGGAYNPWQIPEHGVAYAGHYGYGSPYFQPQPQALPLSPAIEPHGLPSCSNCGSMNSVAGNLSLRTPQAQVPSELNMQQHARSHSSSPHVRFASYGDYIPLTVDVHQLEKDPMLMAFIDKEILKPHYCDGMYNQMTASPTDMQNQSPPPGDGQRYPARPKPDLFVFHIPEDMKGGELYSLFAQFGKLRRASIHNDDDTSETKEYAFITFKRLSDAVVAVHRLNGHLVRKNKALTVTYCRDRPARRNPANESTSVKNGMNRAQRRAQRRASMPK